MAIRGHRPSLILQQGRRFLCTRSDRRVSKAVIALLVITAHVLRECPLTQSAKQVLPQQMLQKSESGVSRRQSCTTSSPGESTQLCASTTLEAPRLVGSAMYPRLALGGMWAGQGRKDRPVISEECWPPHAGCKWQLSPNPHFPSPAVPRYSPLFAHSTPLAPTPHTSPSPSSMLPRYSSSLDSKGAARPSPRSSDPRAFSAGSTRL